MSYLLDTCAVSELRRSGRGADESLVAWIEQRDPLEFVLSAITVYELEIGVLRMERRDLTQGRILRDWLQEKVLAEFEGRVLGLDGSVASKAASFHVPDRRPERDAFIAATALVHGVTVVTRNVRDFEPMHIPLVNPWRATS